MNATVHQLPTARRSTAARVRKAPHAVRKLRQQTTAGVGICLVAFALVALSLSHLAQGIVIVTNAPSWEGWLMAIGVDLGFVALELSTMMAATPTVRRTVEAYAKPAIIGTVVASAAMNAFCFAWQAEGWLVYPAVAVGLAIPALVYRLTRIGATLLIDRRK